MPLNKYWMHFTGEDRKYKLVMALVEFLEANPNQFTWRGKSISFDSDNFFRFLYTKKNGYSTKKNNLAYNISSYFFKEVGNVEFLELSMGHLKLITFFDPYKVLDVLDKDKLNWFAYKEIIKRLRAING